MRDFDIYVGSAWAEYQRTQTVHGIPLPTGLVESAGCESEGWVTDVVRRTRERLKVLMA